MVVALSGDTSIDEAARSPGLSRRTSSFGGGLYCVDVTTPVLVASASEVPSVVTYVTCPVVVTTAVWTLAADVDGV